MLGKMVFLLYIELGTLHLPLFLPPLLAFPSPAAGSETGYAPVVRYAPPVIGDVKVSDCKGSASPKSATNNVLSH